MFTILSVFFNNTEILYLGLGYLFDDEFVKLIFVIVSGQCLIYLFSIGYYSVRMLFLLILIFSLSIISGFKAGYLDFLVVLFQFFLLVAYVNKFCLLSYSARVRVVLLTSIWSQIVVLIVNLLDYLFRGAVLDISYQNVFPLYFALMLFSNEMVASVSKAERGTAILHAFGIRLDYLNLIITMLLIQLYVGYYFIFPDFRIEIKIIGLMILMLLLKYFLKLGAAVILIFSLLMVVLFIGFSLSLVDQDLSIYSGFMGFERENSFLLRIAVLDEQIKILREGGGWWASIFGLGPGMSGLRYDFYHPVFKEILVNLPSHAGLLSIVTDIGFLGLIILIYILHPSLSRRGDELNRNSAILFFIFLLMNIISIQWIPSVIYYHFGGAVMLIQMLILSRNHS